MRSSPSASIAISTTPTSVTFIANSAHSGGGNSRDAYVITHAEIDRNQKPSRQAHAFSCKAGIIPRSANNGTDLLAHIRENFRHQRAGFSLSEFVHFRDVFDEPLEDLVRDFAGLTGSYPAAAAKPVDRVRQRFRCSRPWR